MSIETLNCGNTFSAAATTLTAIAVTVRLPPAASACSRVALAQLLEPRDVGEVVLRDVRNRRPRHGSDAAAVLRRTARIGCRSTSPQRVKSGSGSAAARRRPAARAPGDQPLRLCLHVVD